MLLKRNSFQRNKGENKLINYDKFLMIFDRSDRGVEIFSIEKNNFDGKENSYY